MTASRTLPGQRSPAQHQAAAVAALFGVPLCNFGVSQHRKTFAGLVTADPGTFASTPRAGTQR